MKPRDPSIFNLATCLTISRFFLVPVFIYFFLIEDFTAAVITLIIASITDVSDGFLARRFNMGTLLGSILDPLADKFLMMISFVVLTAKGVLPWWLALVVIGRDFYIVFGLIYLHYVRKAKVQIKPSILSKRTTFSQFVLLTMSFIKVYVTSDKFTWHLDPVFIQGIFNAQTVLVYLTFALTTATFVQYTQIALGWLKDQKEEEEGAA